MRVFIDTAFTDLIQLQLLSAGLVVNTGAGLSLKVDRQTRAGSELAAVVELCAEQARTAAVPKAP